MPSVCPRDGKPFVHDETGTGASINHGEAAQAKTCVVLDDGDDGPMLHLYYHRHEDLEATTAPDAPTRDDRPDPNELTGNHRVVYDHIVDATITGGSIKAGELAPKLIPKIEPAETKRIADELADAGYVKAITSGCFRVFEEGEV